MSDAYEIVWFRGRRFDKMTVQAILTMERHLSFQLDVMQGSYNGGVSVSAGTHDGGGAVDFSARDADRVVRVGREYGHFAIWERHAWEGDWPHHIHGILIGNQKVSGSAGRQVTQYYHHTNGLATFAHDPVWHPDPIRPYVYRVAPKIAIDVSNLQIHFNNALHHHAGNVPHPHVRRIQRAMNRKMKGVPALLVDGVVGEHTLDRWGRWEEIIDRRDPNRIPDMPGVKRLLAGSVWYAIP